jgi:PAS domain S-box-containing protein
MTHTSATLYEGRVSTALRPHLQQMVVKVCLARLLFLILLLLPIGLAWIGKEAHTDTFRFFLDPKYTAFLVFGFGMTAFFLFTWSLFNNILFFFRLQLGADLLLVAFLVILTGGIISNFFFLFLGLIFLYGRILGIRTANIITAGIIAFILIIALWQYQQPAFWGSEVLQVRQLIYYISLQLLALGLVLMLLKLGYGHEDQLLSRIALQEQEFRRSENLKFRVFDWMTSALLVVDYDGRISTINRKALEMSGLSDATKAIGADLADVLPDLAGLWEQWDKRDSFRTEVRQEGSDRILGATFSPIPEEQSYLILSSDITKIKELEQRVNQMEKLATLGELSAGLAHEIKNPLAGIKASLQLIIRDTLTQEQTERLHAVIQRDIKRLDRLISDFLVFARPSQANAEQVCLAEVVHSCLMNVQSQYEQVSFSIDPGLDNQEWYWDPEQLHQVLLNLILNAVQAVQEVEEPSVAIGLGEDSNGEYLSIRDNGPGIDPSQEKHIFDPFITTKRTGTGLGLSIAQRLAGENNSWITIRNKPPQGAEVRVYCFERDEAGQPGGQQ